MGKISRFLVILTLVLPLPGRLEDSQFTTTSRWQAKVDPWVRQSSAAGQTEFLVYLSEQADLSPANQLSTKLEKGVYVFQTLSRLAARSQKSIIQALESQGAVYRSFWVANMIWVRGDQALVQSLAQRADVAHLYANPSVRLDEPISESQMRSNVSTSIEWNILKVRADDVWAAGYTGQGVVIGGQDTGYQWDHPALISQYRGWNGSSADHNYSWHDAIHTTNGSNPCGHDSPVPCDDYAHGTHTMGIMVGDDGVTHQIGMAPGARWIGCRNMDYGVGTPATYSECFQWFIAPTNLNDLGPDPSMAPDIIDNSWSCPKTEGCIDPNVLLTVVNNVRAAGILTVQSAGNQGSDCSTIDTPAAIYDSSYTVGNTTADNGLADSSSRGPVIVDGSLRMKPDISAPGTGIYSSIPNDNYAPMSGTSMAAPHVVGLAALLISAEPDLRGQPDWLESIINATAAPVNLVPVQTCGGISSDTIPNNSFGWGRIDAWAAYQALAPGLGVKKTASPAVVGPGELLTYTLTVINTQPVLPGSGIILTDTIPTNTSFVSASSPYVLNGSQVEWSFDSLSGGDSASADLVVRVASQDCGLIENSHYGVKSDQIPQPISGPTVSTPNTFVLQSDHTAFVIPGQTITFSHTLLNNGLNAETLALGYTSSLGWANASLPLTVTLSSGAYMDLSIQVHVPLDAPLGSGEETTLTASCFANPESRLRNIDRVYYLIPLYFPMVAYNAFLNSSP